MQIRKCVLIEMFSLVLIGMFSPFFHIIGSRIGAFGLFPFGNVLTCHVSLQFWRDTHQRPTQNAASTHGPGCAERAVPHGWTRAGSISRPVSQTQDRNWPQIARGEPGSCELPSATWPAPAASGNSSRQKRDRQPRGCAHAGCTHRHARLPVRAWLTPAC